MQKKKDDVKKKKVMDYRHIIFVIKDTHIKYLCAMILKQKHIYIKGFCPFMLEWWPFFDIVEGNTINTQCLISTTHPPFSMQGTIMRKITDSWCYEKSNYRHISMRYTRVIEVKEVTD